VFRNFLFLDFVYVINAKNEPCILVLDNMITVNATFLAKEDLESKLVLQNKMFTQNISDWITCTNIFKFKWSFVKKFKKYDFVRKSIFQNNIFVQWRNVEHEKVLKYLLWICKHRCNDSSRFLNLDLWKLLKILWLIQFTIYYPHTKK